MKTLLQWANARNLRLAVVAAPWLLAAAYLWLFAADRYVSESVVAVRENGGTATLGVDAISSLFGASSSGSRKDELMLETYVTSMDMLQQLDEKLGLRQSFSAPRLDFFYRLPADATNQQFLAYYRSRVDVEVDDQSGLLRVRTQAFSPEQAEAMNREMLAIGEHFINDSSHQVAREQLAFAESELKKAHVAVKKAKNDLLAFQQEHDVLDPVAQAAGNTGLMVELQGALAKQQAELKAMLAYLNEDAYQVQGVKAQIAGTKAQLEAEQRRTVSSPNGESLNVLAGDFQELMAAMEFAQDRYKLALSALETARVESTRKLKTLVRVESPVRPESPEYPRRIYTLLALLLGLGLLYGIVRLVVATIEDHQE